MTTTLSFKQLFLLSLLIALGATNLCGYTPALPIIATTFHQNISHTQFLVVTSLIGNIITPIVYGCISNRLGTLVSIRLGFSLCIFGDLCVLIAAKFLYFKLLVNGIFLLSLGGNVGMVMALTILRTTTEQKLNRYTAIAMISFAILPGLAILVGGQLLMYWPWQSIFIALLFYHSFLFCFSTAFPQILASSSSNTTTFSFAILKERRFIILVSIAGILSAIIYFFTAQSPHIAMDLLHQSPAAYGWWSNLLSIGMLVGLIIAWHFSERWSLSAALGYSIMMMLIALGLGRLPSSVGLFFGYSALMSVATQLCYPFITSEAMRMKHNYPSSAALFSIGHFLIAGLLVWITNYWNYLGVYGLWWSYVLCIGLFILLSLLIRYK